MCEYKADLMFTRPLNFPPYVEDEQEAWSRYGHLQLSPVSDQVRDACQQHVAQTEGVVSDDAGQHALLCARPLSAFKQKPGVLGGETRRKERNHRVRAKLQCWIGALRWWEECKGMGRSHKKNMRHKKLYISLCLSMDLSFVSTEHKRIDDDSGYCGADNKAKDHIDSEVGSKGYGHSKHGLQSDGQQQDEAPAVPCTQR